MIPKIGPSTAPKIDRQSEKIAECHGAAVFREARKVVEVEQQRGEIGNDQLGGIRYMREQRSCRRRPELQGEVRQSRLRDHPDGEREHHHVNRRPAEIDELADHLHAVEEDQKLEQPHEEEAAPAERR
jgi:hypothetical protein